MSTFVLPTSLCAVGEEFLQPMVRPRSFVAAGAFLGGVGHERAPVPGAGHQDVAGPVAEDLVFRSHEFAATLAGCGGEPAEG